MPCDTQLLPGQTISQRAEEIRRATADLDRKLVNRSIKVTIGPQGAIAFNGWNPADRNRITDACAFRRIMAKGSSQAKAEIAKAEMLAGRKIDRLVIGQGAHSHDGGLSWHNHKG